MNMNMNMNSTTIKFGKLREIIFKELARFQDFNKDYKNSHAYAEEVSDSIMIDIFVQLINTNINYDKEAIEISDLEYLPAFLAQNNATHTWEPLITAMEKIAEITQFKTIEDAGAIALLGLENYEFRNEGNLAEPLLQSLMWIAHGTFNIDEAVEEANMVLKRFKAARQKYIDGEVERIKEIIRQKQLDKTSY